MTAIEHQAASDLDRRIAQGRCLLALADRLDDRDPYQAQLARQRATDFFRPSTKDQNQ